MPLLMGMEQVSKNRKIPQIGSEQDAKEDYEIIGYLSRGKKTNPLPLENKVLIQEPSMERKRRVRTTGCNSTFKDLPHVADRDTQREEGSSDVSLCFLFRGFDDIQPTREMRKNESVTPSTLLKRP